MLNQQTLEKLIEMKLNGMASSFEELIKQPESQRLSFEEKIGLVVDREIAYRDTRRQNRLLKTAKLRYPQACPEDIDYRTERKLDRSQMISLVSCDWIRQQHNLILLGKTGCGKSYLACALAQQACRQGLSVRYLRLPRLFESLRVAHADGSYPRLMNQFAKTELLILDDWGLGRLSRSERNDLLELLEDRHQLKSTLITSQLPIEHWHDYIGNATIADAVLDRAVHNAYRITLEGESMRKNKILTQADQKD